MFPPGSLVVGVNDGAPLPPAYAAGQMDAREASLHRAAALACARRRRSRASSRPDRARSDRSATATSARSALRLRANGNERIALDRPRRSAHPLAPASPASSARSTARMPSGKFHHRLHRPQLRRDADLTLDLRQRTAGRCHCCVGARNGLPAQRRAAGRRPPALRTAAIYPRRDDRRCPHLRL